VSLARQTSAAEARIGKRCLPAWLKPCPNDPLTYSNSKTALEKASGFFRLGFLAAGC
jgi:hypothetical protein